MTVSKFRALLGTLIGATVLAGCTVAPQRSAAVAALAKMASETEQDLEPPDEGFREASVDAGSAALPMLAWHLAKGDSALAAVALAYLGGAKAVDALTLASAGACLLQDEERCVGLKALAATAMASTGRPSDIRFLEQGLRGEQIGTTWMPIVSAALTLGVLRAEGSLAQLRVCRGADAGGSIAAQAADTAIRWIERGKFTTPSPLRAEPGGAVIAAVLENGIPSVERAPAYYDPDRKLIWRRDDAGWTFEATAEAPKLPVLTLKVVESFDSRRAVVSVGLTFGPLDGVGYDYVLFESDHENRWFGDHDT